MAIEVYVFLTLALDRSKEILKRCKLCGQHKDINHFPIKEDLPCENIAIVYRFQRICFECHDKYGCVDEWARCHICGKIDTIDSFSKVGKVKKYASYCKQCRNKKGKEYYRTCNKSSKGIGRIYKTPQGLSVLKLIVDILHSIKYNAPSRVNADTTINTVFNLHNNYGSMFVYKLTQLGILIKHTYKHNMKVYTEHTINPEHKECVNGWIQAIYEPRRFVVTPRNRIDLYVDVLENTSIESISDFVESQKENSHVDNT
jgi:hypothetical protein